MFENLALFYKRKFVQTKQTFFYFISISSNLITRKKKSKKSVYEKEVFLLEFHFIKKHLNRIGFAALE